MKYLIVRIQLAHWYRDGNPLTRGHAAIVDPGESIARIIFQEHADRCAGLPDHRHPHGGARRGRDDRRHRAGVSARVLRRADGLGPRC